MPFSLEYFPTVPDRYRREYEQLLYRDSLIDEGDTDGTALLFFGEGLAACGSLSGQVLKQIAVDKEFEGRDACSIVVSALIKEAFARGESHLFLCTKPRNQALFASLGFYSLVSSRDALLMENKRTGLADFLSTIPVPNGKIGCVVCNCNPMTNGHLHLLQFASSRVDHLLVFVVSEDASLFPSEIRYRLVCEATAGMPGVSVIRSREYLVSRATFPTYFIKDENARQPARDDLDLQLFVNRIAPALRISVRFVGEEPYNACTRSYNERMKHILPEHGIDVVEIPRYRGISASEVRRRLQCGQTEEIRELVPPVVYAYCQSHAF